MRCRKKFIAYAALCLILVSVLIPVPAAATESVDTKKECTLNILFAYTEIPLTGAQFYVYRVGDIDDAGACALGGEFASYPVSSGLLTPSGFAEAAELLYGYALLNQVQPDAVMTIGQNGSASQKLPVGLYLIAGQKLEQAGGIFRSTPMLLSLPYRLYLDEPWSYQVTVNPKSLFTPKERIGSMNRSVMKVWQDGNSGERPQSIRVHLLRDNSVYDTVVLSSENRWLHKWEDLDEHYDWRIVEEPVEGYTVKTSTLLNVFLITNTAIEDPTEPTSPSEPDLPINPDEIPETTSPSEPTETTSPSEPTETTSPSEPTETTSPSEPTETTSPSEPTETTSPSEPTETTSPSEPTETTAPSEPTETTVPDETTDPTQPGATTAPTQSTNPAEDTKPEDTVKPTEPKPDKPRLPQTGMVWWPVPVLLLLGIGLVVLGMKVRRGDRDVQ